MLIDLTSEEDGDILVNTDHIVRVRKFDAEGSVKSKIFLSSGSTSYINVKQTPKEINNIIWATMQNMEQAKAQEWTMVSSRRG